MEKIKAGKYMIGVELVSRAYWLLNVSDTGEMTWEYHSVDENSTFCEYGRIVREPNGTQKMRTVLCNHEAEYETDLLPDGEAGNELNAQEILDSYVSGLPNTPEWMYEVVLPDECQDAKPNIFKFQKPGYRLELTYQDLK